MCKKEFFTRRFVSARCPTQGRLYAAGSAEMEIIMKRKNSLGLFACAIAIVGIGAICFNEASNAVMAVNLDTTQTIPTNYQVPSATTSEIPSDYKKANYHVYLDDLNKSTPTAADMTMEDAAEFGARYLWTVYGLQLENANIYMYYSPGTDTSPRASWSGDVLFSDVRKPESTRWTFGIDAVTGELFDICHAEMLNAKVSLAEDAALRENYDSYAEAAKNYAVRCGLISSPISKVAYNCQGYSLNNPDITVDVIGEKGECVSMTFSRYDQSLLGLTTDAARKISDSVPEGEVNGEVETEQAR